MEFTKLNSILPLVISTAKKAGDFIRTERKLFLQIKSKLKVLTTL